MRNHEVTFIVDPVLSGDEIKATAKTYVDAITTEGGTIVNTDELGLKTLAYPINRRTTGIYYCVEFNMPQPEGIDKFELAMRRDERIMRFLTVALDKYGIKYNDDKRNGKIGVAKKRISKAAAAKAADAAKAKTKSKPKPKPAPTPAPEPTPAADAKKEGAE